MQDLSVDELCRLISIMLAALLKTIHYAIHWENMRN